MSQEVIEQIFEQLRVMNANFNGLKSLPTQVEEIQKTFANFSVTIKSSASKVEQVTTEVREDLGSLRKELAETRSKLNKLEAEMKSGNVFLYNFNPRFRGSSLRQDVLSCLNSIIPNLEMTNSDIKDVFRIRTANGTPPVLIKLASRDLRSVILRSNSFLKRFDLTAAPEYTESERVARDKLKSVMDRARSQGHSDVTLRGLKLHIGTQLFQYNSVTNQVEEIEGNRRVGNDNQAASSSIPARPPQINERVTNMESRSRSGSTTSLSAFYDARENQMEVHNTPSTAAYGKRNCEHVFSPSDVNRQPATSVFVASKTSGASREQPPDGHRNIQGFRRFSLDGERTNLPGPSTKDTNMAT